MAQTPYKLCYPQLEHYDIPIGFFVRQGLGLEYVSPPRMTKRTVELGAKYSPDFVCAPFKSMMGNYIEALERGANVLIQTGGTCRLGYYGELHEQLLRDMGYDFELFNLTLFRYQTIPDLLKAMKHYAPDAPLTQIAAALPATYQMIRALDKVDDYYRQNMGFEKKKGTFDKIRRRFLRLLGRAKNLREVNYIYKKTMDAFHAVPLNKPERPLRVGVVGEYFTIIDTYANHEIEKKLAAMGTEVHRWMNLSNSVLICPEEHTIKKLQHYVNYDLNRFPSSIWVDIQKKQSSYVEYDTGSSSVSTITLAEYYAKKGFDGLIHIKSFGCTPEMDCVPILHNISADYKIPILYMNYDTQTSDTGIETRLEAFYDMIAMKAVSSEKA